MTRVIKLGGRVQADRELPAALAAAWRESPLIIVHGGGDEVSALQLAYGRVAQFVNGKRVTQVEDLELLRMALSGSANKRLVSALVSAGVHAIGLSGEDAALLTAVAEDRATMGEVGTPAGVHVPLLRHLLAGGYCPVISPLARDASSAVGGALNVNGDDAAAAIAAAMQASELLLISDVDGVLVNGAPVAEMDGDTARELVRNGVATGGMAAKLDAACGALARGVARVRIGAVRALMDEKRGTRITLAGVPT
jgi:acetylglutamate kinase